MKSLLTGLENNSDLVIAYGTARSLGRRLRISWLKYHTEAMKVEKVMQVHTKNSTFTIPCNPSKGGRQANHTNHSTDIHKEIE